jgi:hypothetical protein
MDATRFDLLVRSLTTVAPRPPVIAALLGAALTTLVTRFEVEETEAKRKKRKGKKAKNGTSPPSPPSPPPPPDPPPPPRSPGFCNSAPGGQFGGVRRMAQTFLPPFGGQLTAARIFLEHNPDDFSVTFEIRTVDAGWRQYPRQHQWQPLPGWAAVHR